MIVGKNLKNLYQICYYCSSLIPYFCKAIMDLHDLVCLLLNLCPNHVISTGGQMTNLVSNFEYLLMLCFLTVAEF